MDRRRAPCTRHRPPSPNARPTPRHRRCRGHARTRPPAHSRHRAAGRCGPRSSRPAGPTPASAPRCEPTHAADRTGAGSRRSPPAHARRRRFRPPTSPAPRPLDEGGDQVPVRRLDLLADDDRQPGRSGIARRERPVDPIVIRDHEMRQATGRSSLHHIRRARERVERSRRMAMQVDERAGHSRGPVAGRTLSSSPSAPSGASGLRRQEPSGATPRPRPPSRLAKGTAAGAGRLRRTPESDWPTGPRVAPGGLRRSER